MILNDVWKTKNNKDITFEGNGSRPVRVCIYCRVSTDHDEQIDALNNQKDWCSSFLSDHPSLKLVDCCYFSASTRAKIQMEQNEGIYEEIWEPGFYIDAGKSGREIHKREAFQKMISDAKENKFDLIIVRDNSRFSRSIVDLTTTITDLRSEEYGVGVYFASINIFSIDKDADFQLKLLTLVAEQESKTTSDRILRNNQILKERSTLFGNGNILGYDLEKVDKSSNRYKVNQQQAETVRKIFELCSQGLGIQKIAEQLTILKYKNSSGLVKWNYQNIQRILHNKTYCGYVSYNRVKTVENGNGFRRKNINIKEADYRKVDSNIVPPIITEELFNECQEQLHKRKNFTEPKGKSKAKSSKDVFAKKMTCSCGNGFRRDCWNTTTKGVSRYGYRCYNVLNNNSKSFYEKQGIDTEGLNLCDMPAISDIKMYIQAQKVFSKFNNDIFQVEATIEELKKRSRRFIRDYDAEIENKTTQINKQKDKQDKYINLLAEQKINDEQFNRVMEKSEKEIETLQADINKIENDKKNFKKPSINVEEIQNVLSGLLDCQNNVDPELINRFVYQIVVMNSEHFIWKLHFKPITTSTPEFIKAFDFTIDYNEALEYAKSHNRRLKKNWKSLRVEVELAI